MDASYPTIVAPMHEDEQLMRRLTSFMAPSFDSDTDGSHNPIPQAWTTCERLILPTWRPANRLPANHAFKYGAWDDSLTNDDETVREIVRPSSKSASLWWPNTLPKDAQGPMPFEQLPQDFEQRRLYAFTLYCAMLDFSTGFAERLPGVKNTQPNKLLKQTYSQAFIQAKCYDVVEKLVELHSVGAFLSANEDPTARGGHVAEERKHSFEDRFMELCNSVTHFKNVATDLLSGNHTEVILYAPIQARQAKLDANCNNEFKRQLKAFKEHGGKKSQFSGLPSGAGSAIRPSQMNEPILDLPPPDWRNGQPLLPRSGQAGPLSQDAVNEMAMSFFETILIRVSPQSVSIALRAVASKLSVPCSDIPCPSPELGSSPRTSITNNWSKHVAAEHGHFHTAFAGAMDPSLTSTGPEDSIHLVGNGIQMSMAPMQPMTSPMYYSAHNFGSSMIRSPSSLPFPSTKPMLVDVSPQHQYSIPHASSCYETEQKDHDATFSIMARFSSTAIHSMPAPSTAQAQLPTNATTWRAYSQDYPSIIPASMPAIAGAPISPPIKGLKHRVITDFDHCDDSPVKRYRIW